MTHEENANARVRQTASASRARGKNERRQGMKERERERKRYGRCDCEKCESKAKILDGRKRSDEKNGRTIEGRASDTEGKE